MKRNFFRFLLSAVLMMCCTVSVWAGLGTPPDDEIWYTSSDGSVIDPYDKNVSEPLTKVTLTTMARA